MERSVAIQSDSSRLARWRPAAPRDATKLRAFTLIELLVVIAIIAILAAILFPVFSRARASATTVTCISNMQQMGKAFTMYADDNKGFFPPQNYTSWTVRQPYMLLALFPYAGKSHAVFSCPNYAPFFGGAQKLFQVERTFGYYVFLFRDYSVRAPKNVNTSRYDNWILPPLRQEDESAFYYEAGYSRLAEEKGIIMTDFFNSAQDGPGDSGIVGSTIQQMHPTPKGSSRTNHKGTNALWQDGHAKTIQPWGGW